MKHFKIFLTCALLLLSAVAFAQNQIKGHVADSEGQPIIGANVSVKGTTTGICWYNSVVFVIQTTERRKNLFFSIHEEEILRHYIPLDDRYYRLSISLKLCGNE